MQHEADVGAIVAKLTPLDRERLTGWQGPSGAAYNAVSEDLCEMGLLNADWSVSTKGEAVRARILANADASAKS